MMFDIAAEHTQPVVPEIRERLVEPFITATRAAVGEMAGTEVVVRSVFQTSSYRRSGDIAVQLELASAAEGPLIMSFPMETARSLTRRMLTEVADPDDSLICDCVREIVNVVAGQAEALLAGSRYRFAFSVPKVVPTTDLSCPQQSRSACLTVVFSSEYGDLALQVLLH
jgi:CheY-specific phosphatase CheX